MARMRLTNGRAVDSFVPYDNELYAKVMETTFTPRQRLFVDTVIRETIGYESTRSDGMSTRLASKPLSVRRMMKLTGTKRMTAYREIIGLVKRNILVQKWTYCPKRQFELGINYEFWQWDRQGDFLSIGEYIKLHERAKTFVKEEFEKRLPDYRLVKAKRRDKADFRMLWRDSHRYNAIVRVKTSWDGAHKINSRIEDPKPNTYYFIVNRDITDCLIISPQVIAEQVEKVARPVINTKYLDICGDDLKLIRRSNNDFGNSPVGASPIRSEGIVLSLIT